MDIKDALKQIQNAHPDWTFAQCWSELKKAKPYLFSSSLRPATAPDNVPDEKYAHPTGTDSPDPRARPFKNYDERPRDERIVAKAEAERRLKAKLEEVRAANPRLSFKDAWERVKRDSMLMAHTAVVEARLSA